MGKDASGNTASVGEAVVPNNYYGHGMIDAYEAVKAALGEVRQITSFIGELARASDQHPADQYQTKKAILFRIAFFCFYRTESRSLSDYLSARAKSQSRCFASQY